VDRNGDGLSDVWRNQWDVVFRDVIILDRRNVKIGVYNLSEHNLAEPQNYAALRQMLVDAATRKPPWQNQANPLDVNGDTVISPVGDVLPGINELNNRVVSSAIGLLAEPPGTPPLPPFFYDVNGTATIPCSGHLADHQLPQSSGNREGEASGYPGLGTSDLLVSVQPFLSSAEAKAVTAATDVSPLLSRRSTGRHLWCRPVRRSQVPRHRILSRAGIAVCVSRFLGGRLRLLDCLVWLGTCSWHFAASRDRVGF